MQAQMERHFVLRISQYKILRSLQGPAYLYPLRIHEGTSPTVAFIEETRKLPSKPLTVGWSSEFRGRVAITPGLDCLVILRKNSG